jgi:hypothetical protein
MLDLDTIICGDLRPVFNRTEDVVMWKSPTNEWPYNGAMFMANTGARPEVWTDFDPVLSPQATRAAGYRGSDQAWMSLKLGWGEAVWTEADGVYYAGIARRTFGNALPPGARIVFTTGGNPPWKSKLPWVKEHYR